MAPSVSSEVSLVNIVQVLVGWRRLSGKFGYCIDPSGGQKARIFQEDFYYRNVASIETIAPIVAILAIMESILWFAVALEFAWGCQEHEH